MLTDLTWEWNSSSLCVGNFDESLSQQHWPQLWLTGGSREKQVVFFIKRHGIIYCHLPPKPLKEQIKDAVRQHMVYLFMHPRDCHVSFYSGRKTVSGHRRARICFTSVSCYYWLALPPLLFIIYLLLFLFVWRVVSPWAPATACLPSDFVWMRLIMMSCCSARLLAYFRLYQSQSVLAHPKTLSRQLLDQNKTRHK